MLHEKIIFVSDLPSLEGQTFKTVQEAEAAEHRTLMIDAMIAETNISSYIAAEVVDWLLSRYDIKPKEQL